MTPITLLEADKLALTQASGDFSFLTLDARGGISYLRVRQLTYLKARYCCTYTWMYAPPQ